ncbi:MAG: C45 family autoproteolytic acyltransferase/hydrolase, partial [Thermomicrobiales bacterium]
MATAPIIEHTVRIYRRLFAAAGRSQADVKAFVEHTAAALRDYDPDLVQEIDGVATGSDTAPEDLLAINGRTELLAARHGTECSVISVGPHRTVTGGQYLAQNWDWHPDLARSRILWLVASPAGDEWFLTFTEAGVLGKIGLNSRGLGCCVALLGSSLDRPDGGIPIHFLLRLVLQRCASPSDAIRLLTTAKVSASSCVVVASAGGGAK